MIQLSERESFKAMDLFLNQYFKRAGDDLVTLIADIHIESDGGTLDPAAWDDWMACVQKVISERG